MSEFWRQWVRSRIENGDPLEEIDRELRRADSLSGEDQATLWLLALSMRQQSAASDDQRPDSQRRGIRERRAAYELESQEVSRRDRSDPVQAALVLALEQTSMDVAVLGEIRDEQETVHSMAGDGASFGLIRGASLPIQETYCAGLLTGRLSNVVHDAQADPRVNRLPLTRKARIGAYIGVPIRTEDARLYVLCCLAHEQRPRLCEHDVLFMRGVGAAIVAALHTIGGGEDAQHTSQHTPSG